MTIKGYKPHPKQRILHDAINKGKEKYYVLNIGRQFGKSMLGINQLLYWSINDQGSFIGWITPIYKQGKKVFKEFKKYTEKSNIFTYNESELSITGLGSTIQFFSGERPDNIRGNTFDYLICDEFAFTRPNLWSEVLSATVLVKGKKVIFISTPNGKNHFYQLSLQHNYDDRYKYFHFTSYDTPFIDESDLEERKRSLPNYIFKQEYLAEFIDDATGLFKNVRSCIGKATSQNRLFAGLDIGRADDYTVLTIINDKNQMVDVSRYRHDEWSNIIDKVADKIKQYNCKTYVEVNNQGDVFFEMLRARVSDRLVEPYVTTSKTKPIMIEDLAVLFEQKDISILDQDWLIDELQAFTYIYDNKSRSVKYSAPQGVHDDGVMSLALAVQAKKTLGRYGSYTVGKV